MFNISVLLDVEANLPETSPFFVCPNGFGEHLFSNVYNTWDVRITLVLHPILLRLEIIIYFFKFHDAVLTPCGKERENGYTPHNIRIVAISQAVGRTLLTFFHKIERGVYLHV